MQLRRTAQTASASRGAPESSRGLVLSVLLARIVAACPCRAPEPRRGLTPWATGEHLVDDLAVCKGPAPNRGVVPEHVQPGVLAKPYPAGRTRTEPGRYCRRQRAGLHPDSSLVAPPANATGVESLWSLCCDAARVARGGAILRKPELMQQQTGGGEIPGGTSHCLTAMPRQTVMQSVMIDETSRASPEGLRHALVALVLPPNGRPRQFDSRWHAVEKSPSKRRDVLSRLLATRTGILGIVAPGSSAEDWAAGMVRLTELVSVLLPGENRLRFNVEEHSAVPLGRIRTLETSLRTASGRDVALHVQSKGHAFNGYVDLVAHTWSAQSAESRALLADSGLLNTCLHTASWDVVCAAADLLCRRGPLVDHVERLVAARNNLLDRSLADVALRAYAARGLDVGMFRARLDSMSSDPAVDLERYVALLAWLRDVAADAEFSDVDWVALQLHEVAAQNRVGAVESASAERLASAAARIRAKRPHVACHADAVVAVRDQNRFEFQSANDRMAVWERSLDDVFGAARWKGRTASQIGQAAAFVGDAERATAMFKHALRCFRDVEDPAVLRRERGQTAIYWTIATLDDPEASVALKRGAVNLGARLIENLFDSSGRVAAGAYDAHPYVHHVLVRYLAEYGTAAERAPYIAERARWTRTAQHPWELIDLHRARLLAAEGMDASAPILHALAVCRDAKALPTLRWIGEVVAAVGRSLGVDVQPDPATLDALQRDVPALSRRIGILRDGVPADVDAFLRELLPFNLH